MLLRCMDLKTKIHNAKKGTLSITKYCNFIKGSRFELDHSQSFKVERSKNVIIYQQFYNIVCLLVISNISLFSEKIFKTTLSFDIGKDY